MEERRDQEKKEWRGEEGERKKGGMLVCHSQLLLIFSCVHLLPQRSDNKAGEDGCIALAEAVAVHPKLATLKLMGSGIGWLPLVGVVSL